MCDYEIYIIVVITELLQDSSVLNLQRKIPENSWDCYHLCYQSETFLKLNWDSGDCLASVG